MNQINNLESKSDSPDLNIPILIEKASSKANDDFQGSLLELRMVFWLARYTAIWLVSFKKLMKDLLSKQNWNLFDRTWMQLNAKFFNHPHLQFLHDQQRHHVTIFWLEKWQRSMNDLIRFQIRSKMKLRPSINSYMLTLEKNSSSIYPWATSTD